MSNRTCSLHVILSFVIAFVQLSPIFAFQPTPTASQQRSYHVHGEIILSATNGNDAITPADNAVERCYEAWNQRDMKQALQYFAQDFEYDDTQYIGILQNKSTLRRCFEQRVQSLPPDSRMVVDEIASCSKTGNIGTKWHVERNDGSLVPFTNGCSFYTTDVDADVEGDGDGESESDRDRDKTRLITTAFKASEMIVKPSPNIIDAIVSSASRFMGNSGGAVTFAESTTTAPTSSLSSSSSSSSSSLSIIEEYFEAWNKRDMEAALNCFIEECTYQTEDPLFVGTLRGKADLERHLVQNAASLPSACQIILDDLAIDDSSMNNTSSRSTLSSSLSSSPNGNGNIGVKWHLEVNGVNIPNLRGCSMYTTDGASGLLKTGYDVTEQPVKVPQVAMGLLSLPSKLGMLR